MKITTLNVSVLNECKMLDVEVHNVSNVKSLTVLTQEEDLSRFSSDEYMEDPGWMDGSSYIDCTHTYGTEEEVLKIRENLMNAVSVLELDEEQCLDAFFFVFDAGNGNYLLVSNAICHLSYHDVDFEDIFKTKAVTIFGGSLCDDADISATIAECLISHPWTKGFKVPGDELYEQFDEIHSWSDYAEYNEYKFSDMNKIKKGTKFFEMIEADRRLVLNNTEIFDYRTDDILYRNNDDMVGTILKNYYFTKNIPDVVQLEYKHNTSNKFYNIEINNSEVIIEYGAIGKTSTTDGKEFETVEEARKFYNKTVISKIKSGYKVK